jgi:glycosyltransferase involved in cell wall biosynthesis
MIRVLTILSYYHPHWTGLTTHAVRVAEGLVARDMAVTVLTTRHSSALAAREVLNGVQVVRLWPLMRFSRGMIAPAFLTTAARLLANHDVVHMHTPLPEALLVGVLCRLGRRPLLMTHHGDLVMPRGLFNQLLQRAGHLVLRGAGSLADAVTSYSCDYAEHSRLLGHFREKLHYVQPPVELPRPLPGAALAWRERLQLQDKALIGFAGRWVEEKGFDILLRALPFVREALPQAHLVFAGETEVAYERSFQRCRPLLEAQADHVTLLGLIRDPQQMAHFYALCDLYVQPSRTDMMGLAQVEAMLSGTPVVATDIPGARVAVRETGFGRLAAPENARALAATIVETWRERDLYRPHRESVRAHFDPARAIARYQSILQELAIRRASQTASIAGGKDA